MSDGMDGPEAIDRVILRYVSRALLVVVLVALAWGSFFVIGPREAGIVLWLGKPAPQVYGSGLHFKAPWPVATVNKISLGVRTNRETIEIAMGGRIPAKATVSQTWRVLDPMQIILDYGSVETFETVVLDREFMEAAKTTMARWEPEKLMTERTEISARIGVLMGEAMQGRPIAILSTQIEDIDPPQQWRDQALAVDRMRLDAIRASHELTRQKHEAEQKFQLADVEARSVERLARAKADATRMQGEAEAHAIRERASAIGSNMLYVEHERVKQWGGSVPTHLWGNVGAMPMLTVPQPAQR